MPIVSYICDEYYFIEKKSGFLWNYHHKKLVNTMDTFYSKTDQIISICKELSTLYNDKFHCKTTTICTGSRIQNLNKKNNINPKTISYFGNIVGYQRYESLIDIAKCLEELNIENKTKYSLNIYSADTDEFVIKKLNKFNTINFKGYISGKDFDQAFENSDILLHVESFNKDTIEQVKNSVSTKIADSLSSGICLLAYGPEGIASINHLKRNQCAFVATNYIELRQVLNTIFNDASRREKVIENALNVANKYHNSEKNSCLLYMLLKDYDIEGK